jgi:hypothetical protein
MYSPDDPNAPSTTTNVEIRRIEFQSEDRPRRTLPTEEEAAAAIERDRAKGVTEELADLGVPQFVAIRDAWQRLLDQIFPGVTRGGGQQA